MPQYLQQYLGSFFCHDITNFSGEYICELLVIFRRGESKQATEEIHSFPSLKLSKHERIRNSLKTAHNIFSRVGVIQKRYAVTKALFALKGKNWYYLKYNCYCPLRRECGITCMNLNSRTACIMLAMLECMRLTYCVLPKGKALNVRV